MCAATDESSRQLMCTSKCYWRVHSLFIIQYT